jgi:uncharacterized damage-inducible protein DinB
MDESRERRGDARDDGGAQMSHDDATPFSNRPGGDPGGSSAYVRAVLALVGDRDPRVVLEETPAVLADLPRRHALAVLERPEAPGRWSVREVLAHFADSETVWAVRLRLVLAQDVPELTGYDQDAWARRLRYAEVPVADALERFAVLRRANLWLLDGLSPPDLARVGQHAERGFESVEHMIALYAGHDLVHRAQIERILRGVASKGGASGGGAAGGGGV